MKKEIVRTALACLIAVAVGAAGTAAASHLITGGQIRNGSIGLADLSKSAKRALRGAAGPTGPTGPTGPAGPAGPQALNTVDVSQEFVAPPDDFADGEVRCPAGMVALGGSLSPGGLTEALDWPSSDGRGWVGSALETNGFSGFSMILSVVCAPGSAQVVNAPTSAGREATIERQARKSDG